MELNESQARVKSCRARRAIVLAGAGTGKTASATHHVASLIDEGVSPSSILQITFTRKAAQETSQRVEVLTGLSPQGDFPAIGTYHSIASALIRSNPIGFGFSRPTFTLLTESDSAHMMGLAFQAAQMKKSEEFKPSNVLAVLSYCLNTATPLAERYQEVFGEQGTAALNVTRHYLQIKRDGCMADFEDLLTSWRDRLAYDPAYAQSLRSIWKHVIVDEFQDNNPLNFDILKRLAPDHLLVIGDKQQSIYGFRGANCRLIEAFVAESPHAEIIKLEENYRSGQVILDLANQVVSSSSVALNLRASLPTKAKVYARNFPTEPDEARSAITWIEHGDSKGIARDQMAFLARKSRTLVPLEAKLKMAGIAYRKYGGKQLSDAAEIQDLIALLRLSVNPQDTAALKRVLLLFPGIGDKGADKAALALTQNPQGPWPKGAEKVPDWLEGVWRGASVEDALWSAHRSILPLIKMQTAYATNMPARLDNLKQVIQTGSLTSGCLSDFIDAFALSKEAAEGTHPSNAVTLSTIHSAKGLEWQRVWLVGAGDQQMPSPRARGKDELEEEVRLLYVAVTRAKEALMVSYPSKLSESHRGAQEQKPSPYLPDNLTWKTFIPPVNAFVSNHDFPGPQVNPTRPGFRN